MPSPPGNTVAPGTWVRVGPRWAVGSGTSVQRTRPLGATVATSSSPRVRSGKRAGVKR